MERENIPIKRAIGTLLGRSVKPERTVGNEIYRHELFAHDVTLRTCTHDGYLNWTTGPIRTAVCQNYLLMITRNH